MCVSLVNMKYELNKSTEHKLNSLESKYIVDIFFLQFPVIIL